MEDEDMLGKMSEVMKRNLIERDVKARLLEEESRKKKIDLVAALGR